MNLKKLERYLRVNLLVPGPRLKEKGFTGPRSHKGWETLLYRMHWYVRVWLRMCSLWGTDRVLCVMQLSFKQARVMGRAICQTVSRRPITAEDHVRFHWDLWRSKWHWNRFFSQYFGFSPVGIIPPLLHIHLQLHTDMRRLTTGIRS